MHERDTFTGWEVCCFTTSLTLKKIANSKQLPTPSDEPINLIVAVSFGLFVPPRILRSAKYGGLNIHPSLLPKYVDHPRALLNLTI